MNDLRARLLAWIDAELEVEREALPGPWNYIAYGEKACNWSLGTGMFYKSEDTPPLGRLDAERFNEQTGEYEKHGDLIETVCYSEDARSFMDAAFITHARSGYPATLRALRGEVERHETVMGNGDVLALCLVCYFTPGPLHESVPCRFLTRIASQLGVEP